VIRKEKPIWNDGDAYDAYVGRWSRPTAAEFLDWLGVRRGAEWLEVGCGTGALTQAILDRFEPKHIDASDLSKGFLDVAIRTIHDARVTFGLANACDLPSASDAYDAVVCSLIINAVPDQPKALSEFVRCAKPGATVGLYVWDFDGEMQLLRYFWESANALAPPDDDGDLSGFAICNPDRLSQALRDAGLQDVEVRAIDTPTHFKDFDDYWSPFLRGGAPAQQHLAALNDEKRVELREHVRSRLPIAPDGSIALIARAWAGKGIKPG